MEITTKVNYDVAAKAVLRNGDLSVSLTISAPYGGRSVSVVDEQIPPELQAAVDAALQQVIDARAPGLVAKAQAALFEAKAVAERSGEVL